MLESPFFIKRKLVTIMIYHSRYWISPCYLCLYCWCSNVTKKNSQSKYISWNISKITAFDMVKEKRSIIVEAIGLFKSIIRILYMKKDRIESNTTIYITYQYSIQTIKRGKINKWFKIFKLIPKKERKL